MSVISNSSINKSMKSTKSSMKTYYQEVGKVEDKKTNKKKTSALKHRLERSDRLSGVLETKSRRGLTRENSKKETAKDEDEELSDEFEASDIRIEIKDDNNSEHFKLRMMTSSVFRRAPAAAFGAASREEARLSSHGPRQQQNIYTTTLSIGSNRDNVSVFVDTGSTELWVMGSDVQCFTLAEYHVEGSATLPEIFDDQFEFATVDRTSVSNGILGLGIASNGSRSFLRNCADRLYQQSAYSVYLNSADAQKGSVLFGAVDHAKYNGTLVTTPLTHDSQLMVNVTYEGGNYSVLLILVHRNHFDFSVAGTDFEIPIEEILARQDDRCYVGIMASSIVGGGNLFGFNILRHMYIVYDLDDMSISVAPVRYTTDEQSRSLQVVMNRVDLDPSSNATATSTGGANGLGHGSVAWCYALMAVSFTLFNRVRYL
ncbi:Candidapepsin-10 [Candida viswanathii]|uniref:Candidapepsin-10 n=1 Tax=Candida viswanathii TaxID=5486 RepID=A0A367Y1H5_9ASCO|nr:Candidapepsin-10 [Candida viswanathii]